MPYDCPMDDVKEYDPQMGDDAKKSFGRPPKYTDDILEQAHDYLMGEWKAIGDFIPSLEGLASYIGVSVRTIHNWKTDEAKADFLHICEGVMTLQSRFLINNGLLGVYSAPITKMMMVKHGYSDKVENINRNIEPKTVYIDPKEKADMEKNISDVVDG